MTTPPFLTIVSNFNNMPAPQKLLHQTKKDTTNLTTVVLLKYRTVGTNPKVTQASKAIDLLVIDILPDQVFDFFRPKASLHY